MRSANLFILLVFVSSPCLSFVLESSFQKTRPLFVLEGKKCVQKGEVIRTPLQESLERGGCESFAQGVGLLTAQFEGLVSGGTATLITPHAILTVAHVAQYCHRQGALCRFHIEHNGKSEVFEVAKTVVHTAFDEKAANLPVRNNSDIAILFLKKAALGYPTLAINPEPQKISQEEPKTAFVASQGYMYDNKTGLSDEKFVRHIVVTSISSDNGVFVHRFEIPESEHKKCRTDVVSQGPTRFVYNENKDPFLQGMIVSSDSGGPLVARIKNEDQLIGVTRGTQLYGCDLIPTVEDQWDAIAPLAHWVKDTLKAGDADYGKYQPALYKLK